MTLGIGCSNWRFDMRASVLAEFGARGNCPPSETFSKKENVMKLAIATVAVCFVTCELSVAKAQITLDDVLPQIRRLDSVFGVARGATITFNDEVPSVKACLLQDGKQVRGDADGTKGSVTMHIPTQIFDEQLRMWRDTDWRIPKGATFTVSKITAGRSSIDWGTHTITIEAENDKVRLLIHCVGADPDRRFMTSDEFSKAVGGFFSASRPR
jgi:hypothetical protein